MHVFTKYMKQKIYINMTSSFAVHESTIVNQAIFRIACLHFVSSKKKPLLCGKHMEKSTEIRPCAPGVGGKTWPGFHPYSSWRD